MKTGGRKLSEARKSPLMIHCSVGTRSCLCQTNLRKLVHGLGFDDMTRHGSLPQLYGVVWNDETEVQICFMVYGVMCLNIFITLLIVPLYLCVLHCVNHGAQ